MRRTRKPTPPRRELDYIENSILPRNVDARTRSGRRLKVYAAELAVTTPGSDSHVMRARILNVAALLVEAEKMAWRVAEAKPVDAALLASLTRAIDYNLGRLQGKAQNAGAPRKHGRYAGGVTTPTLRRALGSELVQ